MMKHTALPWKAVGLPYKLDDPCIVSEVAKDQYGNEQYVAQTVYDMQSMTTRDEVDADTLFIVEACNSHARLLAVARAAKRIVDSDRWRGLMHIDDLEAALAAVEDLLGGGRCSN
jgi:hypothetical protein